MSNELVIEDIQLGDGKEVVKGALITTQYHGFLEDGSTFDSSLGRRAASARSRRLPRLNFEGERRLRNWGCFISQVATNLLEAAFLHSLAASQH